MQRRMHPFLKQIPTIALDGSSNYTITGVNITFYVQPFDYRAQLYKLNKVNYDLNNTQHTLNSDFLFSKKPYLSFILDIKKENESN